ncbi:MAG: NAD-glutamate dehydrogenase [Gammaproteobacteria bacterium]|nr:NAD-glutamate dehydrogenase [Gammaproteobacteria bacterium]
MIKQSVKELDNNDGSVLQALDDKIKKHHRGKTCELLLGFAKQYFSHIALNDLTARGADALYAILKRHWKMVNSCRPDQCQVEVFMPDADEEWGTVHSVVMIVHADMPFLVESVRMAINRQNNWVQWMVNHGGFSTQRNDAGEVEDILPCGRYGRKICQQALQYVELDQVLDETEAMALRNEITSVLAEVTEVVSDWGPMRERMSALASTPAICDHKELVSFLSWLSNGNFTFLGSSNYEFTGEGEEESLVEMAGSGLGLLRAGGNVYDVKEVPAFLVKYFRRGETLLFGKTRYQSRVHRSAYIDYVGIKQIDDEGNPVSVSGFFGLYTSSAYNSSPQDIPLLRDKVAKVLEMSGLDQVHCDGDQTAGVYQSHACKRLLNIIENLPRDDLFQASIEELYHLGIGILQLQDRQRIRLFMRGDSYGGFYSCLVFVPQDKFTTQLCDKLQQIFQQQLAGEEVSYRLLFTESMLSCIHFLVKVSREDWREADVSAIEELLVLAGQSWQDGLKQSLLDRYGEARGVLYYQRYQHAFSASYCESFMPRVALNDIEEVERLGTKGPLGLQLTTFSSRDGEKRLRFKIFQRGGTIPLSDALPILEKMGLRILDERPHRIDIGASGEIWINAFEMIYVGGDDVVLEEVRDVVERGFAAVWLGDAESDEFNRLILKGGLSWREVAVLRSYGKYLRQLGMSFTEDYIAETLYTHAAISCQLIELFKARFNPDEENANREESQQLVKARIEELLDAVAQLDHDRIFRRYIEVIEATVRVNYYQGYEYLSFKLDPSLIEELPKPRPVYEIYTYSPKFEGVHLRGGLVSRGGLRWSDRQQDFRTEILHLMRTQRVKNAVIVPAGAKGGFIVKGLAKNASREVRAVTGESCYRQFIQSLLDITDNRLGNTIVKPKSVVCYDGDDPYLVVAADKGTASFSDIANEVAVSYDYWLGDAFASGGSTGYDHKKLGITARGGWESVKRHFRELGRDVINEPFTAVGIGDMAGDVFGNFTLLSRHLKLVAAFNHQHIFVDPDPDVEISYQERQRLFALPRSSWDDYDRSKLSKGGGVFSRSQKRIEISEEMGRLLTLQHGSAVTPIELIRLLLKLDVDLLWNGGIGTFVKATDERHDDVGDRTNDNLRINGNELHCLVVGEGGNLGFTQRGRIEYALNGGRLYTDFIDNSAAVNCSDHEVNIKVLLNEVVSRGELTVEQRNELLAAMAEEVSGLVLRDNYHQTQAIGLAQLKAEQNLNLYGRYLQDLVVEGNLDVILEHLPDEKAIMARKAGGKGLTAPEIAVLFAYSKGVLKEGILASDVPEDPYLSKMLLDEFPQALRKNYSEVMPGHILRREIISTQVSNTLINEMGFVFIPRLREETGATVAEIVRAFTICQKVFGKYSLWREIERLDLVVDSTQQFDLMRQINRLVRRATRWLLRNRRNCLTINEVVEEFAVPVAKVANHLLEYVPSEVEQRCSEALGQLVQQGVPLRLAYRVATTNLLFSALEIVDASLKERYGFAEVARVYFRLGAALELDWVREKISQFQPESRWQAQLKTVLSDDLDHWQRELTVKILASEHSRRGVESKLNHWRESNQRSVERWTTIVNYLKASDVIDSAMLTTTLYELINLVQVCT